MFGHDDDHPYTRAARQELVNARMKLSICEEFPDHAARTFEAMRAQARRDA
jgi:hypothetical protein